MRRRRHPDAGPNTGVRSDEAAEAARAFVESLGPDRPRRRSSPRAAFARASEELERMREAGGFDRAADRHLVALYARLHETVYGVAPAELFEGRAWAGAVSAAARLLREEFGGRAAAAIEFVRWVWQRERRSERRRRAGGESGGGRRIGWRLQFAQRHLLTDYRVEIARERETRRSA